MYGAVRESVSAWHAADEAFLLSGRGSMPGYTSDSKTLYDLGADI